MTESPCKLFGLKVFNKISDSLESATIKMYEAELSQIQLFGLFFWLLLNSTFIVWPSNLVCIPNLSNNNRVILIYDFEVILSQFQLSRFLQMGQA